MKKIAYIISIIAVLAITVSMISRNYVNRNTEETSQISIRNDMMLEERR